MLKNKLPQKFRATQYLLISRKPSIENGIDYEQSLYSPRDSRASETRACVKLTPGKLVSLSRVG